MNQIHDTVSSELTVPESESPMLDAVITYMDDLGWNYTVSERDDGARVVVTTRVNVEPVVYKTCLDINEAGRRFGIFAYAPFTVPEDKRLAVMAYLTRANYRLFLAKFELDLNDGELRSVCTAIPEDASLSIDMVRRMRQAVHDALEIYAPGILAIIYGNQTADQAWQALMDREAAEKLAGENDTALLEAEPESE